MTMIMNQTALAEEVRAEAGEPVDGVDFKMVTFSLAGKDYGIDIMKVKEIAKFISFTYVPNAMPFVRGVYNLRGDIISVIDLRVLFHLPIERKSADGSENGLILRLEETVIGVIVDSIEKVVGISPDAIKAPHPIFGDNNIKYLSGVVEHQDRLYIILDVEKILGREEPVPRESAFQEITHSLQETTQQAQGAAEPDRDFIAQTLATFASFHVSDLNRDWVDARYKEWKSLRVGAGTDLQLTSVEDAREFLNGFHSPYTGQFWPEATAAALESLLPDGADRIIQVWNPGCGGGYESYSLAGLLLRKYPGRIIKIWANDVDLLNIASAPNLVVREGSLPAYLEHYTLKGKNGLGFVSSIRDTIYFEYHDILNVNQYPAVEIILARDLLSFLKTADQHRLLEQFHEKLKPGGLLVLGTHEKPGDDSLWENISRDGLSAFRKSAE
jgi:purine-binding chemotaxis protein CheW